jgi:hypothetical protein
VHDLCGELGLRWRVDITTGAPSGWTNVTIGTIRAGIRNYLITAA